MTYATGGTVTEQDGYRIHTFTSSGTLTVTEAGDAEVLVVAGGGGGGSTFSGSTGGGGAGGVVSNPALSLSATSYTITVGAGGTAEGNGGNSSIGALAIAIGGGAGGGTSTLDGATGGSGGGAGATSSAGSAGSGTAGQGTDGGTSYAGSSSSRAGGGGGGAGASGGNAASSTGGDGGAGVASSISGSSVTYAGGGGGSANSTSGSGGAGGGGAGNSSGNGTAGAANTGGGGGGGRHPSSGATGGAGGSGIVIVRYTLNTAPDITAGPTVDYATGSELTPANSPADVDFTVTDAEETGAGEISWAIWTGSGGTGTQVTSGTATSGVPETAYIAWNDSGITDGAQTLYLLVSDGALTDEESFSLTVDLEQAVGMMHIASTATLYQPGVTPGSVAVGMNAISAGSQLYQPSVTTGSVNVGMNAIDSGTTMHQPAVAPGAVNVGMNAIDSTATMHEPGILLGASTIGMNHIAATSTTYQPGVEYDQSVGMQAIASGLTLYTPGVVYDQSVGMQVIASTATLYQPAVSPGSVAIGMNAIGSGVTLYMPGLIYDQAVGMNAIASTVTLYQLAIVPQQMIGMNHIGSTVVLYEFAVAFPPPANQSPSGLSESGRPLITLTNTDTITIDVPSRRRWTLLSTGMVGEATFTLPAESPAATSAYINPDGGSLVHITDVHGSGEWNGIVTRLSHDERGVTVTASQPSIILSRIPVALNHQFRYVSVRHIVSEVFRHINAITGTYPLATGPIAHGPHLVPTYQMHGEDCWSVLQNMMQLSGQELHVRTESHGDTLIWGGNGGTVADGVLMAPGQFRDAVYSLDIAEQISRMTTLSDHTSYSVNAADIAANGWPAHLVVKAPTATNLRALAEAEINRRLVPAVRVEGSVPYEFWTLREGDYVRVLIPWARFTGATVLTRIISREFDEQNDVMRLELQTASGQHTTNRVLDDLRQIVRAESSGRSYLVGVN